MQATFKSGGYLHCPWSDSNSPRIILKRLVFPVPLAPTRPTLLFLCTVKLTSSNKRFEPLLRDRLLNESIKFACGL